MFVDISVRFTYFSGCLPRGGYKDYYRGSIDRFGERNLDPEPDPVNDKSTANYTTLVCEYTSVVHLQLTVMEKVGTPGFLPVREKKTKRNS